MVALTTKGSGGLAINLGTCSPWLGGFFFATHIVAVNKFAEDRTSSSSRSLQFAVFGRLAWIGALALPGASPLRLSGGCGVRHGLSGGLSLLWSPVVPEHRAEVHAPSCHGGGPPRLEAPFGVLCSWWEKRTSTPSWSWALC